MKKGIQKKEVAESKKKLNKKEEQISNSENMKNKQKKENKRSKENKENKTHSVIWTKYHQYLWYFLIFSLIGLALEAISAFVETKIFNKEMELTLGPLCFIYGLGAIITIICLQSFKGKKFKLFILGTILGATIQYAMSFILEAIFGAKLWDCGWSKFSINGRTCIELALVFGIITVILINIVQKYIDKLINKVNGKTRIIVDIIVSTIITFTLMLTIWGVITYTIRAKEVMNGKNYTSNNNIIEKFQNTVFANEIMEKILPRIKIVDNAGNLVLIKNINN